MIKFFPMKQKNLKNEIILRPAWMEKNEKISGDPKVELLFHIDASKLLSLREKAILKRKLNNIINVNGFLHLFCQETNSMDVNKMKAIELFYDVLEQALRQEAKSLSTGVNETIARKLSA